MNNKHLVLFTGTDSVVSYFARYFPSHSVLVMNYSTNPVELPARLSDRLKIFNANNRHDFSREILAQPHSSTCISCFSGYIFSEENISHFDKPIINFHTGKIPDNRGRSPLFWDILDERQISYGSLHTITPDIDMGRVLDEVSVPIRPNDNPRSLANKLLAEAFKCNIFLKWSEASKNEIESIATTSSNGTYKKAFHPYDDFVSTDFSVRQLLLLWRCFQIWGRIKINGIFYTTISCAPLPSSVQILCNDRAFVYGLKEEL